MSSGARLSVAISQHPSRDEFVRQMIERMDVDGRLVAIQKDEHLEGIWANVQKAWRSYDPDATHHLVLEDDLAICTDLLAGAEAALDALPENARASSPVSLFHAMGDMIPRAMAQDSSWAVSETTSWAQALILPVPVIENFLDYALQNARASWHLHCARLSMWAHATDRKIYYTAPTLVQHLAYNRSLFGIPGNIWGNDRISKAFIGEDVSALSVDWTKRAQDPPHFGGHPESLYRKWKANPPRTVTNDRIGESAAVQTKKIALKDIQPYWNNPRYNADAVEGTAASIQAYGYNQPIILDPEDVIIAGHTRLMAMKFLKWPPNKKIDVVVADLEPKLAREYRIADNKTGELSEWDKPYLMAELREFEEKAQYFSPEELDELIDENIGEDAAQVTGVQIDAHRARMEAHHQSIAATANRAMVDVKCTECGQEFALNRKNALESARIDAEDDRKGSFSVDE